MLIPFNNSIIKQFSVRQADAAMGGGLAPVVGGAGNGVSAGAGAKADGSGSATESDSGDEGAGAGDGADGAAAGGAGVAALDVIATPGVPVVCKDALLALAAVGVAPLEGVAVRR